MLTTIREDLTFGISVALSGTDVVGFTYGHRLLTDHRWWERFTTPVPSEVTREWDGRTFALIDIGVSERWRGEASAVAWSTPCSVRDRNPARCFRCSRTRLRRTPSM